MMKIWMIARINLSWIHLDKLKINLKIILVYQIQIIKDKKEIIHLKRMQIVKVAIIRVKEVYYCKNKEIVKEKQMIVKIVREALICFL